MFNLPAKELEVLKFWQEKNIFKKTLAKQFSQGSFVFYEGPPTANGKPGIHHVEARAFKDLIPRYKTMRGFKVQRKAGWDTHGLPVELEVEKKLGLKNKKEVEEYGIQEFNQQCKESVWQYVEEWEKITERIGFWVDMQAAYVTYDNDYIETLWWIIKQISDRGLMYKGYKVVPQCPRCGTALSSHEVAQGYKNVKEESVIIEFRLISDKKTSILAWTTTPWTLPGNVALAVGDDIDYVKIEKKDAGAGELVRFILAKAKVEEIFGDEEYKIVEEFKGKDLVGLEYEPLFPGVITEKTDNYQNAFKVYAADFVSTEDGTGVVHTAVMYGIDDYELGEKIGLPKIHTVNLDGTFNELVSKWQGKFVKDVEAEIIKDLEERGILFASAPHAHDYPFCWRCDSPLIYYAKDSWFFKMSELRQQLIKNNSTINWFPEHIKEGRFGEWLKEAKDWAISRERYWGTPLPVWICDGCGTQKVVGSYQELNVFKPLKNHYYLLRHGEAENNVQDILCGRLEDDHYHLTDNGKQTIQSLIPTLKQAGVDVIIHSPFLRTTETAALIAASLNLLSEKNDLLWEVRMGQAEGKSDEWVEKNIGPFKKRLEIGWPQGENMEQLKARVRQFVVEMEEKYVGKKILVVSHGDTLCSFISLFNGKTDLETWKNNYPTTGQLIGSFDKMFQNNEQSYFDPHRPFIDEITLQCEKCAGVMKRTPEVMDCWFDSGAMPLAQIHYPFENRQKIDSGEQYPAEYISEAIDQTRGWFYTLLAVAILLGKEAPYKNVICLGHLLDKKGQKMSKHIGNVINPWEMFEKYGADVVRWYLYTVNQPGEPKRFDESFLKDSARMFNTLFNTLTFYQTYVNEVASVDFTELQPTNILDQWIAAQLNLLIKEVSQSLENYDITAAARKIEEFINELSIWYVRRSRDRFKGDNQADKLQSIYTLGKVLFELSKLLAPFIPFSAEYIYQELGKNCGVLKESVHLEDWPICHEELINQKILDEMNIVRKIVELGLAKRAEAGIKIRQPLQQLSIFNFKFSNEYIELIKDELNIKSVSFEKDDGGELKVELETTLTDELKTEGLLRDLVRVINNLRKEMRLTIQDRIQILYHTDDEILKSVFVKYTTELQKQTLADNLTLSTEAADKIKINAVEIKIKIVQL